MIDGTISKEKIFEDIFEITLVASELINKKKIDCKNTWRLFSFIRELAYNFEENYIEDDICSYYNSINKYATNALLEQKYFE